ncbi:hypothetical protein EDD16DRAFT_1692711 [Pisolithus croceorrhizus]|nr:hypothetical protein EDD16DRAFT_1692711 [Pisolithus croceorrhizus]
MTANALPNDALLYRLLHTKLLSGSLNEELGLSHAQKEKALSGEFWSFQANVNWGRDESIVREEEHNKASKRERSQKQAKNLGNYHPILKQMYASCSAKSSKRKRERGLRMGIGRFKGGVLKLSREEISTIAGPARKRNRG